MPTASDPNAQNSPGHSRARLPALLNIEDVAGILGVSVRHVRRLVAERRIPFIKWGRYLRFDLGELEAWIDNARIRPFDLEARARRRRAV
jgi:excisionase family DNA binding protein